jgi:hypothetical protein
MDKIVGNPAILVDMFGMVGNDNQAVRAMGATHAALGCTFEHSGKGGIADRITGLQIVLEGHRFPPNLLASKQTGFLNDGGEKADSIASDKCWNRMDVIYLSPVSLSRWRGILRNVELF